MVMLQVSLHQQRQLFPRHFYVGIVKNLQITSVCHQWESFILELSDEDRNPSRNKDTRVRVSQSLERYDDDSDVGRRSGNYFRGPKFKIQWRSRRLGSAIPFLIIVKLCAFIKLDLVVLQ